MAGRAALLGFLLALLGLVVPAPSEAGGYWRGGYWRGGVFIGAGPWWGYGYRGYGYPYWYPPPYYYSPYYYPYYSSPTVVVQEPPVYIERPSEEAEPSAYWYFCRSAPGYYPSVQTCPEDWVKVPPRP
ncbi:MAG TPA: hypothetical protein VIF59_05665 [Methylomirabilota bacterium]